MRWFSCKVCEEKDKRIADLKEEIKLLRKMQSPDPFQPINVEANQILSGSQEIIDLTPNNDEIKAMLDVEREAVALLTGNYN